MKTDRFKNKMKKKTSLKILLPLIFIILLAAFSYATGETINQRVNLSMSSQGTAQTEKEGMRFIMLPEQNATLIQVDKYPGELATYAALLDNSKTLLTSAAWNTSGSAIFNYNLTAGTQYYVVSSPNGTSNASRTTYGIVVPGSTYPYFGNNASTTAMINWTGGMLNDADSSTWAFSIKNITLLNISDSTVSVPLLSFVSPTPGNNSAFYYTSSNFTVNTTAFNFGGTGNTTHYLYNETDLVSQNNGTGQANYTSSFSNLSVGSYHFIAIYNNGSFSNSTENRTVFIYLVTPGNFTNPNVSAQAVNNGTINVTWYAGNYTASNVSHINYTLTLLNGSGFFNRTLNNSLVNQSFFWNTYLTDTRSGTYYFSLATCDSNNACENTTSLSINLSYPSHLAATGNFTFTNGFANGSSTNVSYSCYNNFSTTINLNVTFNGVSLYVGSAVNNQTYSNLTNLTDGNNVLSVFCYDAVENTTFTLTQELSVLHLALIDEVDNVAFNVQNLSSVRVYFDDNSTYFDFKTENRTNVTFSSNLTSKLRFEFKRWNGDIITTYVDVNIPDNPARICANKNDVQEYEQAIVSSSVKGVALKNVFSNCYVAADYTRFAYQNSYILKAFTISSQYYLYTYTNGQKVYLASIDGSIQTYIQLDSLEFNANQNNLNVLGDALSFSKPYNTTVHIFYKNILNNNNHSYLTIVRTDTDTTLLTLNETATPNEISLYFDYATLSNVTNKTIFKVQVDSTSNSGLPRSTSKYFTIAGKSGQIAAGIAIAISLILVIFGLTFASSRTALGWFGIVIMLAAIAILTLATPAWYVTLFMAIEVIVLVFIVILLANQSYGSVIT